MALNPPLLPGSTLPLPVNGETFVLQRKGVQIDADILVRARRTNGCAARAASIYRTLLGAQRSESCLYVGVIVLACIMCGVRMQVSFVSCEQSLISLSRFVCLPHVNRGPCRGCVSTSIRDACMSQPSGWFS